MIVVPRELIWPGQLPTNASGTPRSRLAPFRPYYTIHYTGGGVWLDPDDTPTELRAIQNYAASALKPWEYNYVIDGQGAVWEYAGGYQAAHSAGENHLAIGVLLLVGFKGKFPDVWYWEDPTEPMIEAVQELRFWLEQTERLALNHVMRPHRAMPDAATLCPGPPVMARWDDLIIPYVPPIPPTPPRQISIEDNMQVLSPARRVYDSRVDDGPLKAGQIRTIDLGLSSARAAEVNLTCTGKALAGYAVAFGEAAPPATSNVNFQAGQTQANAGIVVVTGGRINVWASTECDLIVDLQAFWP